MTNGEKIQQDFKCEVCEPIIEDNIIHVIFADKPDSAIGFDWDWWNAEYKEPTTDKIFTMAELDSMAKAINYGWELRVNEVLDKIRTDIDKEYEELDGYDPRSLGTFACRIDDILDKYKAETEDT